MENKEQTSTDEKKPIDDFINFDGINEDKDISLSLMPDLSSSDQDVSSPISFSNCAFKLVCARSSAYQQTMPENIPENLQFVPMRDDGNCLYAAIACALPTEIIKTLRKKTADYILEHRKEYEEIILALEATRLSGFSKTFEEYVDGIRTTEWGDDLEASVLGLIFNRLIVVIGPDGKAQNRFSEMDISNLIDQKSDPIFIRYNGHNHYDGLRIVEPGTGVEILCNALPNTEAPPSPKL